MQNVSMIDLIKYLLFCKKDDFIIQLIFGLHGIINYIMTLFSGNYFYISGMYVYMIMHILIF